MGKVVSLDRNKIKNFNFEQEAEIFSKNGIEFVDGSAQDQSEVIALCKDADVVMTVLSKIPSEVIDTLENCKAIICYGIGFDQVDISAAAAKGIRVCNVPDYCTEEVAVHTVALILGCIRKVVFYDTQIRKGIWNSGEGYSVKRASKTSVGLIGFGNIARNAASYLASMGFKILVSDPFINKASLPDYVTPVTLDELLAESDIISVHAPNTKDTFHMINEETIKKMKDGVIIVNTARGFLIKEDDMIKALEAGKVKAAGFDVWESEPVRNADHPLCKMDNVILTPHAGHVSIHATHDLHVKAAENAVRVLKGETPLNIVNGHLLG